MLRLEDLLRSDMAKGIALGIGAAVLVPIAAAALAPVAKPLVRAAAKAGLRAYERAREVVDEIGEVVEDGRTGVLYPPGDAVAFGAGFHWSAAALRF